MTKTLEYLRKNRQIFKLKNPVLMLLFMSFHFTQSCAFIAYLFVFIGLLFVFYWGKSTQFFGSAKDLVRFSSDILVLDTLVIIDDALTFFPKIRITTALLEIT
jgi:hypothetical protein